MKFLCLSSGATDLRSGFDHFAGTTAIDFELAYARFVHVCVRAAAAVSDVNATARRVDACSSHCAAQAGHTVTTRMLQQLNG